MIPSRSNARDIEKLKKVSTIKVSEHVERDFTAKFCRYCKTALGFAVEGMIHPSSDAVNEALDGKLYYVRDIYLQLLLYLYEN